MENRYQRLLLSALCYSLCSIGSVAQAQGLVDSDSPQVVNPEIERREISPAAIDTEDFEVGPYVGILSIEDFGTNVVYGARAAWHVTEDFFLEFSFGSSEGDQTSYEELSGGSPLFEDDDRDYLFYDASIGWNVLPGEIFLFDKRALKSDLYLVLGAGSTDFLGDNWFTLNVGAGYRLLLSDSLAWRLDVRDHMFDRDTFGEDEVTHNLELSTGLTWFF
jgi:outer membrane beta-barrel protein